MKKQLLFVVLALAAMAMLDAFVGQRDGAILCAGMAGIGGLIAAFGFQKGFRCTCVNCGESVFVPKQAEEEAKASLEATGWRWWGSREHCPACVQRGLVAATQSTSH